MADSTGSSRNAATLTAVATKGDSAPPAPAAGHPTPLAQPVPFREVGPVRLVCELGRGGMGVVWRGRHQVLGRDVAVKFLLHAVAGAEDPAFELLVAEARSAATVRHANLVPIYHADVDAGVPYLVMEYVSGPSLAKLMTAGRMSAGVAMAVLADAAAAVAALHERGLIHRDLKPANILLGPDAHVYVADFGLALPHKRGGPQSQAAPAGTPLYMAPETFAGQCSPRSDVYALGVVAFELLTGRPPFTAKSADELRQLHASADLPLERLREAGAPDELVDVIGRATNKAPVFRYKSAREFGHALAALAAGQIPCQRTDLRRLVIRVLACPGAAEAGNDGGSAGDATGGDGAAGGTTTVTTSPSASAAAAPWDDVLSQVAGRFRESRRARETARSPGSGPQPEFEPPAPTIAPVPGGLQTPAGAPALSPSGSESRPGPTTFQFPSAGPGVTGTLVSPPKSLPLAATVVIGLLLGGGVWLWLFALAFNSSDDAFYRAALLPLLVAAGAAVGLGVWSPRRWLWAAAALSAPTVILTLTFFLTSGAERSGGHHAGRLFVAASVAAAAFAGAAFGRLLRPSDSQGI